MLQHFSMYGWTEMEQLTVRRKSKWSSTESWQSGGRPRYFCNAMLWHCFSLTPNFWMTFTTNSAFNLLYHNPKAVHWNISQVVIRTCIRKKLFCIAKAWICCHLHSQKRRSSLFLNLSPNMDAGRHIRGCLLHKDSEQWVSLSALTKKRNKLVKTLQWFLVNQTRLYK